MAQLHLLSPLGFRAGGVYAGIKSKPVPDVGLLVCDTVATAAAAFTTNKVFAAPVKVGREHIAKGELRGVVVNAGNANACTGKQGEEDARRMCRLAAGALCCSPEQFLPSSTGIIGHLLPMRKLEVGILAAARCVGDSHEHALLFGDAIMTTDLKRKTAGVELKIGGGKVRLCGVCKGSGMIGPRMKVAHATMLAYLTTDVQMAAVDLRKMLSHAVAGSFNAVTVDDHASTNDTVCVMASGLSGVKLDSGRKRETFSGALSEVCQSLAYQIAADGEGATKVVTILVRGASNDEAAQAMARAIAVSPLVKCAMHGNDPNWGRIVSAAGMAGVRFDPNKCTLRLQGTAVFRAGRPVSFNTAQVSASLKAPEVVAELSCGLGKGAARIWTCDFSKEYVTINADYHT